MEVGVLSVSIHSLALVIHRTAVLADLVGAVTFHVKPLPQSRPSFHVKQPRR